MLRVNKTNVSLPPLEGSWNIKNHNGRPRQPEKKAWKFQRKSEIGKVDPRTTGSTASTRSENSRKMTVLIGRRATIKKIEEYHQYVKNLQGKSSAEVVPEVRKTGQWNSNIRYTSLHDEQAPLTEDKGPPPRDTFTSRTIPLTVTLLNAGLDDSKIQRKRGWVGTQSVSTLTTQRQNLQTHPHKTPKTPSALQLSGPKQPQKKAPAGSGNTRLPKFRESVYSQNQIHVRNKLPPNRLSSVGSARPESVQLSSKTTSAMTRARVEAVKQIEAAQRRGYLLENIREKARRMGSIGHIARQRGDAEEMHRAEGILLVKARMLKQNERRKTLNRIQQLEVERGQIHRKETKPRRYKSNQSDTPPSAGLCTPAVPSENVSSPRMSSLSIDSYGRRKEKPQEPQEPQEPSRQNHSGQDSTTKHSSRRISQKNSSEDGIPNKNDLEVPTTYNFVSPQSKFRKCSAQIVATNKIIGKLGCGKQGCKPNQPLSSSKHSMSSIDESGSSDEEDFLFVIKEGGAKGAKIEFKK